MQLIIPPLTLFRPDETLDLDAFQKHCDFLARRGVDALFVTGTTGEFPLLREKERIELFRAALEAAGSRTRIIAHVGAASTVATRRLALEAKWMGVHAVAAVTPYYFGYQQPHLIQHYAALLEVLEGLPLYAYTIPQRAGNDLDPTSLATLAGKGLAGIKDSSADMNKIVNYLRAAPALEIFVGADSLALAVARSGVSGIVTGPGMVMPELFRAMLDAEAAGDRERAEALHRLAWAVSDILGGGARIHWMRAGMAWRGLPPGNSRSPLPRLSTTEERQIAERLEVLLPSIESAGVRLLPL